jgi:predicted Zn-dependent protease
MADISDAAKLTDRVAALVEAAKKAGADAADAVAVRGRSTSVSVRLGKVEATESSEAEDVSLRVFVGRELCPRTSHHISASLAREAPDRGAGWVRLARSGTMAECLAPRSRRPCSTAPVPSLRAA